MKTIKNVGLGRSHAVNKCMFIVDLKLFNRNRKSRFFQGLFIQVKFSNTLNNAKLSCLIPLPNLEIC